MGQYFKPSILAKDKKTVTGWFCSHSYDNGLKLMEHSYMKNEFVGAVEKFLSGNPQRIVWAGDYANPCKGGTTNVYSRCEEDLEITPIKIPGQVVEAKYIVNHTKKQFIDKSKVPSYDKGWRIHPLPLLTCEGNGRGCGDFSGEDNYELVGKWARDIISVEEEAPKKYTEVIFPYVNGQRDD
jgi:hypothetical protein